MSCIGISSVPSLILVASESQARCAVIALTFSPLLAASARLRCSAAGSFASASNSVPGRNAQQAVVEVGTLLYRGYPEVVDADLADYFGSIPHSELLKSVARRIVDRRVLHRIKMWQIRRQRVLAAQPPISVVGDGRAFTKFSMGPIWDTRAFWQAPLCPTLAVKRTDVVGGLGGSMRPIWCHRKIYARPRCRALPGRTRR
jgi:hypothetical protein